jgi:PII-like signaling protein
MEKIKRIEIIILEVKADPLCEELQKKGIGGFTLLRGAEGFGGRGYRHGDELTGVSQNAYILIAANETECKKILEVVRPALHEFGGVCIVSDALSLVH